MFVFVIIIDDNTKLFAVCLDERRRTYNIVSQVKLYRNVILLHVDSNQRQYFISNKINNNDGTISTLGQCLLIELSNRIGYQRDNHNGNMMVI